MLCPEKPVGRGEMDSGSCATFFSNELPAQSQYKKHCRV